MVKRTLSILACLASSTAFAVDFDSIVTGLGSEDYAARNDARTELKNVLADATKPSGDVEEQKALESLIRVQLSEDLPLASRLYLIRTLELFGTRDSAEALYLLLEDADAEIRDSAFRALSSIPAVEISAKLTQGLTGASVEEQADFIEALAYHRDVAAAPAIAKFLKSDDAEVVDAAALALGKLQNKAVVPALVKALDTVPTETVPVVEASLLEIGLDVDLAKTLIETGSSAAIKAGAFRQLVSLDSGLANEYLGKSEGDARRLFLRNWMGSGNKKMQKSLVASMGSLTVDDQVVVVSAVGSYGLSDYEDEVLALLPSSEGALRLSIVETLSVIGSDDSFDALYELFLANSKDRNLMAAVSKVRAPSADAKAMKAVKKGSDLQERQAALQVLALRNSPGTTKLLNQIASSSDDVKLVGACFKALESVGNFESVKVLVDAVVAGGPNARPAQRSLKRLSLNFGAADLLWKEVYEPAIVSADDDGRERIVLILDGVDSQSVLDYLKGEAMNADSNLSKSAIRTLSRWSSVSGGETWVSIISAEECSADLKEIGQKALVRLVSNKDIAGSFNQQIQLAASAVGSGELGEYKLAVLKPFGGQKGWSKTVVERLFGPYKADPDVAEMLQQ